MPDKKPIDRIIRKQEPSAARRRKRQHTEPRTYRGAWSGPGALVGGGVPAHEKLSDATSAQIQRAVAKYGFIQRFIEEGCPRGQLMEYARAHAAARGLPTTEVPPYTTLNTWVHRFRAHGLVGLIDQPRRDAGVSRTVKDEAKTLIELGLALGHGTSRVLSLMSGALSGDLPKYHAVRRELRRLEQEEPMLAVMAKRGPTAFRDLTELTTKFPAMLGGRRIAIDSTVLDRWVKVPDSEREWRALRPVLTVIEDVGSRLLVTFNLSLLAIDSGICSAVLGRAIDQRYNYPGLLSVGVPYEITLDKGSEHQAKFLEAVKALQIDVVPRNDNSPRGGAHVERVIGTITTEVCPNKIGYSKCERIIDPYAPSDRDTKRNIAQLKYESYKLDVPIAALSTLAELEAELLAWATVYNSRPHEGLEINSPELQGLLRAARIAAQRRDDRIAAAMRGGAPASSEVA